MKANLQLKKWMIVLLHSCTWVLVFSLPYLLQLIQQSEAPADTPEEHNFYLSLITNISWIVFFYLNAFLLIPKLVYKKRYSLYAFVLIIIFSWLLFQISFLFKWFYNFSTINPQQHLFFVVFVFLFMLASSTAYRTILDRIKLEKQTKEKENENLKTELAFLRSQVSPHFMFNVLNNMVALARKKSDDLEPSLIKLSSLLRYMLYETDEEKVPLQKEIEYLKSYIDLQTQRFGTKVKVHAEIDEPDANYFIEPMLLIPFVENAFKHGTGLIQNAGIDIKLYAKQNRLYFFVSNKIAATKEETKDKTSGIGLQNVTRRLNLLYRNNHVLNLKQDESFIIELNINLY